MTDFNAFLAAISSNRLAPMASEWAAALAQSFDPAAHGKLDEWQTALAAMPRPAPSRILLDAERITIGCAEDATAEQQQQIEQALRALHPWRKGPYEFFGTHIDTEWRSDWKWNRVLPHISSLTGR